LEGLAIEDIGTFYCNLVFLRPFGIFFPILVCCTKKIWQPCLGVAEEAAVEDVAEARVAVPALVVLGADVVPPGVGVEKPGSNF
jgi:hypothetical protein